MQRVEQDPQDFGRVLSSMCTEPHPAARDAAERFLATNPGDPGTYETVAKLERRAVDMLGEIVGQPDVAGYVASGGTEANIQAVRIARNRFETDTRNPNVVAPQHAHFSFWKAADVLGVELRTAPLSNYTANLEAIKQQVDADTIAVVGVAGSTEYGRVDDIPALADIAADVGALCHVDAAWGGFVLPFTSFDWNFASADVDTMTIDPHKMGQAAVPAGGLLARGPEFLDELAIGTPYLESTSQVTLTGTRSGAGVASAVAAMETLWPDGYREQYYDSQANAEWLAKKLRARGFEVVPPVLPIVAADMPDRLIDTLRDRGWRLSRTGTDEARIVMMPHVDRSMLREFVDDIDAIFAEFDISR